jgi:hypothetical protein
MRRLNLIVPREAGFVLSVVVGGRGRRLTLNSAYLRQLLIPAISFSISDFRSAVRGRNGRRDAPP